MLSFRKATIEDMELYFEWANDPEVRKNSYHSTIINFEQHKIWFQNILNNNLAYLYLFEDQNNEKVGQVRIQKKNDFEATIGISIVSSQRGKGYADKMLILATDTFLTENKECSINAYIKEQNSSSKFSFEKAGFEFCEILFYENIKSFHYKKTIKK